MVILAAELYRAAQAVAHHKPPQGALGLVAEFRPLSPLALLLIYSRCRLAVFLRHGCSKGSAVAVGVDGHIGELERKRQRPVPETFAERHVFSIGARAQLVLVPPAATCRCAVAVAVKEKFGKPLSHGRVVQVYLHVPVKRFVLFRVHLFCRFLAVFRNKRLMVYLGEEAVDGLIREKHPVPRTTATHSPQNAFESFRGIYFVVVVFSPFRRIRQILGDHRADLVVYHVCHFVFLLLVAIAKNLFSHSKIEPLDFTFYISHFTLDLAI